jgi:tetratricopeptide (TPR) repeat protein
MKQISCVMLSLLIILPICACGQKAPTYQEQYDLGAKYLDEGNYQEAVVAFTAAIEIEPNHAEAYIGLSDAYVGLGDLDAAKKALTDGLAACGDNADLQVKLEELGTGADGLNGDTAVKWADPVLEQLVRTALNIPERDLTVSNLDEVKKLTILGNTHAFLNGDGQTSDGTSLFGWKYLSAPDGSTTGTLIAYYGVKSNGETVKYTERGNIIRVEDLRYFRHLEVVTIIANQIRDVSVIAELPLLRWVNFFANDIADTGPILQINGDLDDQEQFVKIGDTVSTSQH